MAAFDELKILITGDTSGIESSMKKALNVVQGGVEAMNDETVDWTAIFSRSVSPAIISSVASVFAFAIAQSVNFQTAMATTGTAAGETSTQIGQMSQSALNLSTTVPQSAQDIANSMAQVSAIFGNVSDQQTVVAAMSELATAGFGSLNDITSASIDIFKQFGVTTTDQAIQVLTDLMHSAEAAKETIPDLANQFSGFSDQLPAVNKNVDTFNGLISTFGAEIKNVGASGTEQIFAVLASSSQSAVGPMELLGTSFGAIQKSLLTDGGLSAIQRTSDALLKMGPGASLIATNFGLSATQVGQFQTNASHLPQVAADAKAIATNSQTIDQAFQQADVGTNQWFTDWNKLKALLISSDIASVFDGIAIAIGKVLDLIAGTGGLSNLLKTALNPTGSAIGFGISQLEALFGGSKAPNDALTRGLQSTGVGFSNDSLSRIDQTAASSGLMDSLLSALSTGIKGNQYTQLVNTFHLNVPAGAGGLNAKQIAAQLYSQFQGTQ